MSEQLQDKVVHKIEKIEKVDVSKQVDALATDNPEEVMAQKAKFDSAVQKADTNWQDSQRVRAETIEPVRDVNLQSPIDQLGMAQKKIQRLEPASADQLIATAETLQSDMRVQMDRLETASKQMPSDAKLSPVFDGPLSERLVHIDSSLRSALGIVGTEVKGVQPPAATDTANQGPLVKFLNYLTHGDRQLSGVVGEIQNLQAVDADKLSPAKLMAVQIKLTFVQQELEFFTNVLNKALESTKTIMNVQI